MSRSGIGLHELLGLKRELKRGIERCAWRLKEDASRKLSLYTPGKFCIPFKPTALGLASAIEHEHNREGWQRLWRW